MDYRRIRLIRVGKSQPVDFAARELTRYLKAADSSLVVDQMLVDQVPTKGSFIVLKVSEELAKELNVQDAKWDDGYRIRVKNDMGVIEGTNERSVLLGVYRFLKELGFAFTRPGKGGERIPGELKKEYEIDLCEKASYRHRGVTIEGADSYQHIADMLDFIPKCGMNAYFIQFLVPKRFFDRWYGHASNPYLPAEDLDRETVNGLVSSLEDEIAKRGILYHKTGHGWTCVPFGLEDSVKDPTLKNDLTEEQIECLAMVNGKRELRGNIPLNTNLCYSNPMIREKITDTIVDYTKANPQIDVMHFWLGDGKNNHCECENCRKKRPSDWYVQMLNDVDEKLTKAGLTTRIVFLIYVDLLWEPEVERIKNPDRFTLMFAPITRYYGVNYADSEKFEGELAPYERNQLHLPEDLSENLARLERWQDLFKGDTFIFDYHLQWAYVADPGCEKAAKNLFDDMCYLDRLGMNGSVSCQVQRCFFPSGLEFYAMGEALWNNRQKFEELKADYYRQVFKDKGKAVEEYLSKISGLFTIYEKYAQKRPEDLKYVRDYDQVLAVTDAFLPIIEEGIAKDGQALKDWQLLRMHTVYVKKLAAVMKAKDEGEEAAMEAAIEDLCDFVNQNELFAQDVLDGDNLVTQLKNHMRENF